MVNQTACAHNFSFTAAQFNQQSLSQFGCNIDLRRKPYLSNPFVNSVPNRGTMISSPYPPQQNRTYPTDKGSFLLDSLDQLLPNPYQVSASCLSPAPGTWKQCHVATTEAQEKLLPFQLKHTKNLFNVKYIPLKHITGYHCSGANNVRIIVSQLIAVRQIEATGLILLKQWNKKVLAKQITGKFFNLLCHLSLHH